MLRHFRIGRFILVLIIFSVGFFSFAPSVSAQIVNNYNVDWLRQAGPGAQSPGILSAGVAFYNGASYMIGTTIDAFSGYTLQGETDAFLIKYDTNGSVVWKRQFDSGVKERAKAVAADSHGVYVVVYQDGGITPSNGFLYKYDEQGNLVWSKQFAIAYQNHGGFNIDTDSTGIYLVGSVDSALAGQTYSGLTDAFVRKYDLNGNEVWTRQFGTSAFDVAQGVLADSSGIYISGYSMTQVGQFSYGDIDGFLRKFDLNGNEVWTRQFGTTDIDRVNEVASDASGVYVFGTTAGAFPDQTNPDQINEGGYDGFIVKYDTSGNQQWVKQFGTSENEVIYTGSADATGIYLGGITDGAFPGYNNLNGEVDAILVKYNSDGVQQWVYQFSAPSTLDQPATEEIFDIVVYGGTIYLTGHIDTTFPGLIFSGGPYDYFLVKIFQDADADGIWDFVDTTVSSYSNNFSDGTTTGIITNRGAQILKIHDADNVASGVTISAAVSGGGTPARVSACNGATNLSLKSGDSVTVTCASVHLEVLTGEVLVEFIADDGTLVTTTVNSGNSIVFQPETVLISVPETNTQIVVVLLNGKEFSLVPNNISQIVQIDIKPGSDPNSINLGSNGVIPVAILTTQSFDARTVDPLTITLEGAVVKVKGKSGNAGSMEDVDGDGDLDLVVQVENETTPSEGSTSAALSAKTSGGILLFGTDSLNIVP